MARNVGVDAGPGRLTKRSEFLAAAAGRRFHTPRMTVQSIMRTEPLAKRTGIRIGLTVTKKTGHATERSRIKRRLRAGVRAVAPSWPHAELDLVVVARRDVLAAPFSVIVDDLARAVPALLAARDGAPRPRRARGGARSRAGAGGASPAGLPAIDVSAPDPTSTDPIP